MILLNTKIETNPTNEWILNGLIIAILLLLFLIYLFFFKNKKDGFLRYIRYFLLPFTFLSGLVVYFIGYQLGSPHQGIGTIISNILGSVFSTTRLFILGNDLVEIKECIKENAFFHAMFALTAALAAFIFISFLAHVFFKNWLIKREICMKNAKENHFFFGINSSALSLAIDLLKNDKDRLVVFINGLKEYEDSELYSKLPKRAYVIGRKTLLESISLEKEEGIFQFLQNKKNHSNSEVHEEELFHKLKILLNKIDKAETHLYFFSDNEDWNIKQAKQALIEIKKHQRKKAVRIHLEIYETISEKHFLEYSKLNSDDVTVIKHHYATLISRKLIGDHHPVDFIEIDTKNAKATTDFDTLVIGFGQVGTQVLRKLIEQGQFEGSTFHATVIDKYMNILQGRFEHLYPGIKANYDIHFIEAEVGHTKFYSELKGVIDRINYIVIALGNDNLNIQTALEILETNSGKSNKSLKIFVQLEDASHWRDTLSEYKDQIGIFGESCKVFSEKNILQSEAEKQCRTIHKVYGELYRDDRPFDKITRHEQLSNISVAEHLYAKVRLLGYEGLTDFSEKHFNNEEYKNSLSDIQKLNLSIGEHLRWNAFHYVHGWTSLPIEEIPGANQDEKYKNRKNTDAKRQSCLTTWEKLKELSDVIGIDMQKADIDSVENLYNFINYKFSDSNAK